MSKHNAGTVESDILMRETVQPGEETVMHFRKPNRFAKVCRSNQRKPAQSHDRRSYQDKDTTHGKPKISRKVNQVTASCAECCTHRDSSSSDAQYVFVVNSETCTKHPGTHVMLNGIKVGVIFDSGASVNIISETVFSTLKPKPRSVPPRSRFFPMNLRMLCPSSVFLHATSRRRMETQRRLSLC